MKVALANLVRPDALIVRRPHFRQVGNDLYFFLSKRVFHSLNPAEAAIWNDTQHRPVPVRDVDDIDALLSLAQAQVIDLVAPVSQENRGRILVVEPHCDDAALSIGATMWQLRNEVEFHILTMASRSNYSSAFHLHRNCFNRSEISRIRASEGELFAMHLGGRYHCAGLAEATLRYEDSDWDLDFFIDHKVPVAVSNNRPASAAVLNEWVDRLSNFWRGRDFDEIWIPLGAGTHGDHDLARNASLEALSKDRPGGVIRIYEDVPYGAEFQEHTDRIVNELDKAGAKLTPWPRVVTDDYEAKRSLLSIFASQFKVPSIEAGVDRSAGASPRRVERLWTMDVLPSRVPQDEIWIGAPEIADISPSVSRFLHGSGSAKRLAILSISAVGRWREDLDQLRKLFPRAKIVVYAGSKVSAEFQAADCGIELHRLNRRGWSWVVAALREVVTGHRLVIAGGSAAKAEKLAALWLVGRKLIVRDMEHFIQAALRWSVPNVEERTSPSGNL